MKFIPLIILFTYIGVSCSIKKPQDFTFFYDRQDTRLDCLINMNGCYLDSINKKIVLFYRDGLSISAHFGIVGRDNTELIKLFEKDVEWAKRMSNKSTTLYGRYVLKGDSIINQHIDYSSPYGASTSTRIYTILSETELYFPTDNGYYKFYTLTNRMDSTNWLLKEKWFWQKEAWESRNKK